MEDVLVWKGYEEGSVKDCEGHCGAYDGSAEGCHCERARASEEQDRRSEMGSEEIWSDQVCLSEAN